MVAVRYPRLNLWAMRGCARPCKAMAGHARLCSAGEGRENVRGQWAAGKPHVEAEVWSSDSCKVVLAEPRPKTNGVAEVSRFHACADGQQIRRCELGPDPSLLPTQGIPCSQSKVRLWAFVSR